MAIKRMFVFMKGMIGSVRETIVNPLFSEGVVFVVRGARVGAV
jgi:hypothetical protein